MRIHGLILIFLVILVSINVIDADKKFKKHWPKTPSGNKKPAVQPANIEVDKFGVERSDQPFANQPRLFVEITSDVYPLSKGFKYEILNWFNKQETPVSRAEALLADDMKNNKPLNTTWAIAQQKNPKYNSTQLAAYAYSMSDPENLYKTFNDVTSGFRDDTGNYTAYYYKGLYALLLLACEKYDQLLYRGVSYPVPAATGQYMRFNRFLSASSNLTVAQIYASTTSVSGGTIFYIRGSKCANPIVLYSRVPGEAEHLISQDVQFYVEAVSNATLPDGNRFTKIDLVPVPYKDSVYSCQGEPLTKKKNKKNKQDSKEEFGNIFDIFF